MNAKPAPYSLPVLIPGFTVQWDGAAVWTRFDDYRATISGVVTETATGRQWRCHAWADRAGFPLRDGVQLNYLGKRAGAPVQPNHIPNAWAIVRAAWNDLCIEMRDAMVSEDVESMSGPERRARFRARSANREGLEGDKARRASNAFAAQCPDAPATAADEAPALPAEPDAIQTYEMRSDGCQAAGAIVLRRLPGNDATPYVVHFRNNADSLRTGRPCYYSGDYCANLADAWQAFGEKVRRYDPAGALGVA